MIRLGRFAGALSLAGAAVFGVACVGSVGSGGSQPGGGSPSTPGNPGRPGTGTPGGMNGGGGSMMPPAGPPPTTPSGAVDSAGPMPLRRLTLFEYNNTLRDLLGDATAPGKEGSAEHRRPDQRRLRQRREDQPGQRRPPVPRPVGDPVGRRRRSPGDAAAPGLLPPPRPTAEEKCARDFIKDFGLRAFRRPVTSAEETDLFDLYTKQRAAPISAQLPEAIRVLIAGMVQSPYFMYRWEGGDSPEVRRGRPGEARLLRDRLAPVLLPLGDHARPGAVRRRRQATSCSRPTGSPSRPAG